MTARAFVGRKKQIPRALFLRRVLPLGGVLFCMALFLRDPALAAGAVTDGLRLTAQKLIPAVFPFLVLSDLLLTCGGVPAWATRPAQYVFRLPAAGAQAVLLGWLCGFPIGAQCAIRAMEEGTLTREEAERTVAVSSVPSPAFLLGAVGSGLFGDRGYGLFLEGSVLFAAALSGVILARFTHDRSARSENKTVDSRQAGPFAGQLTAAVRKAALTTLNLAAFVVFFSAVSGAAGAILTRLGAGEPLRAAVNGLLELSGGAARAAALPDAWLARLLCAGAAGWGGISVHFQIASVCAGQDLRLRRYLFAKGLQCLLCLFFTTLFLLISGR